MARKKLSEKVESLKAIFEQAKIEIADDQIEAFASTFDLMKEKAINEAVQPFKDKTEEYQKTNFELRAKLEEANNMAQKYESVLAAKIKELQAVSFPKAEDILKLVEEKVMKASEAKLDKFIKDKDKKLNESLTNFSNLFKSFDGLKLDESVKKVNVVGNLFNNYREEFAGVLTEKESKTVQALREENEKLTEENSQLVEANKQLEKSLKEEKETTEVTLMLENSVLEKEDKDFLFGMYEKTGYSAKEDIAKYIQMKEQKIRNEIKARPTAAIMKENRIKPTNESVGFVTKKRPMNESVQMPEMDEWCKVAGIEETEKS